MGPTSGLKVDEKTKSRCRDIATAIYLDDDHNLNRFLPNGRPNPDCNYVQTSTVLGH